MSESFRFESDTPDASRGERIEKRTLPVHWHKEFPVDLQHSSHYAEEFEELLNSVPDSWYQEYISDLSLGYLEAFINAAKYGSNGNPDAMIAVTVDIDASRIQVSITDINPVPFDPATAFDSVGDEHQRMASHGRGQTMMRYFYPDEVRYEFMNPGNKVIMLKKNPALHA